MDNTHQELGQIAAHLARHKVDAIIIGGWNIDVQFPELQYRTRDIDFIIATDDNNYERLAAALNDLEVRETRAHTPMRDITAFTAAQLRFKPHWRLHCKYGIFDIMSSVGVIESYEHLLPNSQIIHVAGSNLRFANPEIILVSKRAAGRVKDKTIVDALEAAIQRREAEHNQSVSDTLSSSSRLFVNATGSADDDWSHAAADTARQQADKSVRRSNSQRCGFVGPKSRKPCVGPVNHKGTHYYR